MAEMFQYEFFRNAFIAGLLSSIACGIVGSLVVSKRLVSIAGGIAHASFGGIGLGYLLKINPLAGAFIFGIISSLGIGVISKRTKYREDTSIGIIWAIGMSLGIVFIGMSKGYAPDLFTYLFGNILAVTKPDIIMIAVLDLMVIMVMVAFYKEIVAISFDEEFARIRGVPVFYMSLGMLVVISLTVIALIKVVGVILIIALLAVPAAASSFFTRTFKGMIILSICLSIVFIAAGLFISYKLNLPAGATIVLFSVIIFLCMLFVKKNKRQ